MRPVNQRRTPGLGSVAILVAALTGFWPCAASAVLVVPMTWEPDESGAVVALAPSPDATFDEDDLQLLQSLGVQVAGAIESARRYEAVLEVEPLAVLDLLPNAFQAGLREDGHQRSRSTTA